MRRLLIGLLLVWAVIICGCSHPRLLVYYEDGDSSDFNIGSKIVVPSPTPPVGVLP